MFEIIGKSTFSHSIGLRVLTQMRGYPIWLDPRPGRLSSCCFWYLLCLADDPIRPRFQAQTGIILPQLC
ncbi:MAG: hypothetical protein ABW003_00390 [Microvirga sp.]